MLPRTEEENPSGIPSLTPPGKIANDDNGDIACDSYHRYAEDIALLKELGVKAYRFSTSWARIEPNGDGVWNEAGLTYYDKLVDGCLNAGIIPYMTLYHWELPQAYEDQGGWRNEETAFAFGRYAAKMAEHFQGRVKNYFTLNEPQCTTSLGHQQGIHAPGLRMELPDVFKVHLHQMIAHGLALRAIKAADPDAVVGIASTGNLCYPQGENDIAAAREATFCPANEWWVFTHHWLLDPICLGRFPECAGTALEPLVQAVTPEQLKILHAVPDILGFNIYNGHEVRAVETGTEFVPKYSGFPRTALKWPVTPEVMGWGVKFLHERYGLPMFITENGLSCNDKIYLDRIDFLTRYLDCLHHAM